jgi:hypothetical protein
MRIRLFIAFITVTSCAKSREIDVMTLRPVCDTIPPNAFTVPPTRVPTVSTSGDRGAIVGTAVEAGTGRPLVSGDARLYPADSQSLALPPAFVDSVGGFALRDVAPGAYTLRIRAVSHRFEERRIGVRSGVIDTIRVALRYFTCVGY